MQLNLAMKPYKLDSRERVARALPQNHAVTELGHLLRGPMLAAPHCTLIFDRRAVYPKCEHTQLAQNTFVFHCVPYVVFM